MCTQRCFSQLYATLPHFQYVFLSLNCKLATFSHSTYCEKFCEKFSEKKISTYTLFNLNVNSFQLSSLSQQREHRIPWVWPCECIKIKQRRDFRRLTTADERYTQLKSLESTDAVCSWSRRVVGSGNRVKWRIVSRQHYKRIYLLFKISYRAERRHCLSYRAETSRT